jgi:DNA-directed RNA polymerase subunit RPC12/RpoP
MQCPKCGSNFLMIKMAAGLERLLVMVTGLREYRCQECDQKFRALDRRNTARAGAKVPASHRQAA